MRRIKELISICRTFSRFSSNASLCFSRLLGGISGMASWAAVVISATCYYPFTMWILFSWSRSRLVSHTISTISTQVHGVIPLMVLIPFYVLYAFTPCVGLVEMTDRKSVV